MQQLESSVPQVNAIRLARVSRSYPAKHCVDVVFLDDGGFAAGVPVLTASASQGHGLAYLPKVAEPDDDNGRWSLRLTGKDDVLCAVASASGTPVVLGFFFPAGEHMAVAENELLDKHISGFSRRIEPGGDMSLTHPSGWKICMHESGGVALQAGGASVVVKPDGNVYLNSGSVICSSDSDSDSGDEGGVIPANEILPETYSPTNWWLIDLSHAKEIEANRPSEWTTKGDPENYYVIDTSGLKPTADGLMNIGWNGMNWYGHSHDYEAFDSETHDMFLYQVVDGAVTCEKIVTLDNFEWSSGKIDPISVYDGIPVFDHRGYHFWALIYFESLKSNAKLTFIAYERDGFTDIIFADAKYRSGQASSLYYSANLIAVNWEFSVASLLSQITYVKDDLYNEFFFEAKKHYGLKKEFKYVHHYLNYRPKLSKQGGLDERPIADIDYDMQFLPSNSDIYFYSANGSSISCSKVTEMKRHYSDFSIYTTYHVEEVEALNPDGYADLDGFGERFPLFDKRGLEFWKIIYNDAKRTPSEKTYVVDKELVPGAISKVNLLIPHESVFYYLKAILYWDIFAFDPESM